jgi:hypothetical protein
MKGDFSRLTFDPDKHYSGVLQQQGRVLLDADWNEERAIDDYRRAILGQDAIGPCGAPNYAPGFELTIGANGKLVIGKGHYYVDGILAENGADVTYDAQPDFPSPPAIDQLLAAANTATAICYLDIWQRHITPLDDPHILEQALGGVDTTTRLKTIWQVKFLPVQVPQFDIRTFTQRYDTFLGSLRAYQRTIVQTHPQQASAIDSLLKILETFTAAGALNTAEARRSLAGQLATARDSLRVIGATIELPPTLALRDLEVAAAELAKSIQAVTCGTPFAEWPQLTDPTGGTLTASTDAAAQPPGPCFIPPSDGFHGSENQLYRVEIHQPGVLSAPPAGAAPTFKWSRDNGSIVTALEKIDGAQLTVHDLGRDQVSGFAPGQWVEIIDDRLELSEQPGQLVQIVTTDPANRTITVTPAALALSGDAGGVNPAYHPKVRRWDQEGTSATGAGIAMTLTQTDVENGLKVQFSVGTYRTGQYWTIPARANGQIEWPPYQVPNVHPAALPPQGIRHHYCRLALIQRDPATHQITVQDCRRLFAPLAAPAMRVISMNWQNDEYVLLSALISQGLQIMLDAEPIAPSINTSSLIVTLERPTGRGQRQSPLISTIIDGTVSVISNVITWVPDADSLNTALKLTFGYDYPPSVPENLRMRVVLKGHMIWMFQGVNQLHLDGAAFGQPFVRVDGLPGTSLILPSGSGARASDFESWLFLGIDAAASTYGSQTVGGDLI